MRQIKKSSTDKSVVIRIIDSTAGTPEEGVTYATSGLDLWYRREGGAVVSITEATLAAVDSAHSDGGIIHIGNGYYRFDLPDAAFATGASSVMIGGTVTGMIVIGTEIQLVNYDPEDAVRLGLTALPNAAADAAGGLPISDAGGLDLDTLLARLDAAISTRSPESGGNIATILGRIIGTLAAGTHNPQSGDTYARIGAPAGSSIAADIADIPTVSEFNARTLAAADYTVVSDLPVAPDNASITAILEDTGTTIPAAIAAIPIQAKKNVALSNFAFIMTDSTNHEVATGQTVTCTRSIDGGAFAAGSLANVTEVSNGVYNVDFLAADLNGDVVVLRATATGCDDTFVTIVTAK